MSDPVTDAVRKACGISGCKWPHCSCTNTIEFMPNAIATAILAERERCAGKATAEGAKHTGKHPERATVAWNIAAAIRSDQS